MNVKHRSIILVILYIIILLYTNNAKAIETLGLNPTIPENPYIISEFEYKSIIEFWNKNLIYDISDFENKELIFDENNFDPLYGIDLK